MISFNLSALGIGPQVGVHTQPAGHRALGESTQPQAPAAPQDGVSVKFPATVGDESVTSPRPPAYGRLQDTALQGALQSLPPEGKSAGLLNAKRGPMTNEQRSACIADLEILNLTGQLKAYDPSTGEISKCSVGQALACMGRGESIFYQRVRNDADSEIADLAKLSAAAQQAKLGILT